jgi:hypothetical protein
MTAQAEAPHAALAPRATTVHNLAVRLLRCMSPLLAQSGHHSRARRIADNAPALVPIWRADRYRVTVTQISRGPSKLLPSAEFLLRAAERPKMTSPGPSTGAFLVAAPLERAEAVSDVSAGRPATWPTLPVAPVAPTTRTLKPKQMPAGATRGLSLKVNAPCLPQ